MVNSAELDQGHYLPPSSRDQREQPYNQTETFDASSKEKNKPSLKDCLKKGENLVELIPSTYSCNRFRLHKYGEVADIEKAFLQIGVHTDDRDFLRFLWIDDKGQLIVYRHVRVVFRVNCSPFMLSAIIRLHLEKTLSSIDSGSSEYSREVVGTILESFM